MVKPTEWVSPEYMAGLTDGEGWIGIVKGYARMEIQMTDRPIIQKLKDQFGGNFYTQKRQIKKWRPVYRWTVYGKKCLEVVRIIAPFLQVKKPQGELIEELFIAKAKKNKRAIKKIEKKIRALNKVGVDV